jgi:uncharacterized protein (TIGR03790 family)
VWAEPVVKVVKSVAEPTVELPATGLSAQQLALIINSADPLSVKIGEYYQQRRQLPADNVIRVRFEPGHSVLEPGVFAVMHKTVLAKLPPGIEAFALAWAAPYRVGCMSISSAFAFGYDEAFCATGCKATARNPTFKQRSGLPFSDHQIRPTMLLAATNFTEAKALIDRGVAADGSWPAAAALLVTTPDTKRNVRQLMYPQIERVLGKKLYVETVQGRDIQNRLRLMFYFTGDRFVHHIDSNEFLPGAIADHLTSSGGQLTDSLQMSALRWLEGGATASYGTVVEPCNMLAKFPDPLLVMDRYLKGATVIEAYWGSVAMPGQGVFIGEPLAKPYAAHRLTQVDHGWRLDSPQLLAGRYRIEAKAQPAAPWQLVAALVLANNYSLTLPGDYALYRVSAL